MNVHIGALAMIAALGLGSVVALPAAADPNRPVVVTGHDEDMITRRVSYADLDLSNGAAQQILFKRVHFAVRKVCLEATSPSATSWEEYGCRRQAWGGAKPQIASAIDRANQMARNGSSDLQLAAIRISVGR
nr:UrcA family protein [uncultured Sphingomonas sp.]